MKKFISMVMAAAMVVSLVPATAFAAEAQVTNTVKVVNAAELAKPASGVDATTTTDVPELQIKVKDTDFEETKTGTYKAEFTVTLDNAEFLVDDVNKLVSLRKDDAADSIIKSSADGSTGITTTLEDDDEIKVVFETASTVKPMEKDDVIVVDLMSKLTKKSVGTKATVSFASDDFSVEADDLVYATIVDKGIKASIKKTVDVAEEEKTELYEKGLVIEPSVGDTIGKNIAEGGEITLKLSKGFEFVKEGLVFYEDGRGASNAPEGNSDPISITDDNEITIKVDGWEAETSKLTIKGIEIEATSAKAGDVATITVGGTGLDKVKVEVAKVVDYKVVLSVDEDEDVPVFYSGVDTNNTGLTDDADHWTLEVTAEETFPGAWSMRKGFSFELPEGVYVTDVDVTEAEYFYLNKLDADEDVVKARFFEAYQEGDHVNFEFDKRAFDDVDNDLRDKKCAKMTFQLQVVADPTFEGDVVLTLKGDLVDTQEVTIAKFVKPYTVKAEQNDLKIDYRYTEIPTSIVITEAEAGLWAKASKTNPAAEFNFTIDDKADLIIFEDDATFEIDADSELEVDDTTDDGALTFVVDEESEEAATVTIKDMSLFMQRNIPAGPYDLTLDTSMARAYNAELLFAPDHMKVTIEKAAERANDDYKVTYTDLDKAHAEYAKHKDKDCYVGEVNDYSDMVKEGFVNIITAGREVDDASFTTKVVVPVGESYIISGETQITLDVPAYINAAGYTMLPVRAVAVALGINTQNVLWDQATKTVTILYGQRIITMVAGQKVVYVNGSAIPASAAVEIVDGRTFLPMRDLATALGVTDITWDAATKTATLNGNQK